MKRLTNPIAFPGDQVLVENYKKHNKQVEPGKVLDTRTIWPSRFRNLHMYKVELDRRTCQGKPIELDIQNHRIKSIITQ